MGRNIVTLKSSVGRRIDEAERRAEMAYERRSVRDVTTPLVSAIILSGGGAAAAALIAEREAAASQSAPDPDLAMAYPEADLADLPGIPKTLPEVEDSRFFQPNEVEPLRRVTGRPVRRLIAAPPKGAVVLPAGIAVPAKDSVILCIRRKARRGVLLALGQGGGYHRKPRRTPKSDIWC